MGNVICMRTFKLRRILSEVVEENPLLSTPVPHISSWVLPISFSADQMLIINLERMVVEQTKILYAGHSVYDRERAAIQIGEIKMQLRRLRIKLENKDSGK